MYRNYAQFPALPPQFRPNDTYDRAGLEALAEGLRESFRLSGGFSTESIIYALQKASSKAIQSCVEDSVSLQFSSVEGRIDFAYFEDVNLQRNSLLALYAKHLVRLFQNGVVLDESWEVVVESMRIGPMLTIQPRPIHESLKATLDVLASKPPSEGHYELRSFLMSLQPLLALPATFWRSLFAETFPGVAVTSYADTLRHFAEHELANSVSPATLDMPAYTFSCRAESLLVLAELIEVFAISPSKNAAQAL